MEKEKMEEILDILQFSKNLCDQENFESERKDCQRLIDYLELQISWKDDLEKIQDSLLLRWGGKSEGEIPYEDLPKIAEEAKMLLREKGCKLNICTSLTNDGYLRLTLK